MGGYFGLPPMLQSSVSSIGSLMLQNLMNGFGASTATAVTTAYRVDSIAIVPIINLGSGISTLVAQEHVSGHTKHAKKALIVGAVIMEVISLLRMVLVITIGETFDCLVRCGRRGYRDRGQLFSGNRTVLFSLWPCHLCAQLSGGGG